ncbi:MAG: hypothetical protein Q8K07_01070 [Methylicorpusculum sp.]|uniref:hypothetical protein n=1 Tax=Methylicorpusculum sp. TaxID=2713644 RepID=UPI0027319A8F|nr:hypothetical protein [Methylicorpusculum sp.]MDP2200587.1 hypothetical protein [Methylicorpusculum sp.]
MRRQVGVLSVYRFIKMLIRDAIEIFAIETAHLESIHLLMQKYTDLTMDLADASLVILAEELGPGRILSTDIRDFQTYRWKNRKPFDILLLPSF